MAERYCKCCEGWHDLSKPWPIDCYNPVTVARSDLPGPIVLSDAMEPTQSMLDGKLYTSKSKLRSTYRAAGVVEVGNDPARFRPRQKPKPDKQAIKAVLDRAEARFNNGERVRRDRIAS